MWQILAHLSFLSFAKIVFINTCAMFFPFSGYIMMQNVSYSKHYEYSSYKEPVSCLYLVSSLNVCRAGIIQEETRDSTQEERFLRLIFIWKRQEEHADRKSTVYGCWQVGSDIILRVNSNPRGSDWLAAYELIKATLSFPLTLIVLLVC